MNYLIDRANRENLRTLFLELHSSDTPALWGKMTPQQMVEHLIDQVHYAENSLACYSY